MTKKTVTIELSLNELNNLCHALLMESSRYLTMGSKAHGNYRALTDLYDRISPLRDGLK